MEGYRYILYLQRCNGYWISEPYQTLEEVQEAIDILDEEEYWQYFVKDITIEKTDGYGIIYSGRVHTKIKNKTRNRKGR